jgi:CDP-paratose 2-epimerase
MFWHFYQNPRVAEVYNVGGSRYSNCSILEAIDIINEIAGKKVNWTYSEANRNGDHMWWISDVRKFKVHYPPWDYKYGLHDIVKNIHDGIIKRKI